MGDTELGTTIKYKYNYLVFITSSKYPAEIFRQEGNTDVSIDPDLIYCCRFRQWGELLQVFMIQLFPAPITNTLITMEGRSYNVNWKIYGINGTSEVPEVTQVVSMRVVNDTYQNSVVMLLRNSQVRVAEIFSLSSGSVDASIAVQNLLNTTAVYYAVYEMSTNHQSRACTYGIGTATYRFPVSFSTVDAMPGGSWGFGGGSSGTQPGTPIIVNAVSKELAVQPSISVTAREPSVGSGAVSFYIYWQNVTNGVWTELTSVHDGSSTGNLAFTRYGNTGTVYFYSNVKVYASYSYGGSYSQIVGINFTATDSSSEIYTATSGGTPVGYIVNSMDPRLPSDAFGNGQSTALNTKFLPYSTSYGVNSVSQVDSFYSGNRSIGNPDFPKYPTSSVIGYFQNYQNSNIPSDSLSALFVAFALIALSPDLGPIGAVSIALAIAALIVQPTNLGFSFQSKLSISRIPWNVNIYQILYDSGLTGYKYITCNQHFILHYGGSEHMNSPLGYLI
ncbi:hypothetical protein Thermo_00902 [Thermoplasmatales archaeon]|nr:hypothetical protein Thermo_00902 [Thermoplasmatales archaeon]